MIDECPRCGGAIPMDAPTPARYEPGECSRCRFIATTSDEDNGKTGQPAWTVTPALADGSRMVSNR